MPKIIFETVDGSVYAVEARAGQSLMEAAVQNGVPGIVAECGGACACATCHVYIEEAFLPLVGPAGDWEDEMLEDAVSPRTQASRLSCQVRASEATDGIRVLIAEEQ